MKCIALSGSLLLFGCGQTAMKAANCEALVADDALIERCIGGDVSGEYLGDEKCYPFSEQREFKGILLTGFEWSEFYPNIDTYNEADRQNPIYWFEQTASFESNKVDQTKCTYDCAFIVSFIGRESVCDAHFGHLGSYPKKVIAERDVKLRQLDIAQSL